MTDTGPPDTPVEDSLEAWTYAPLKTDRTLRILVVSPTPQESDALRCRIEIRDDGQRINANGESVDWEPYEALSWRWPPKGEPKPMRILIEDGAILKEIKTFQTLYEAIIALRSKDKDRYLWIDSICIDQDNAAEKNAQVRRMSEVYGDAFNVCIWLGPWTDNTHLAFKAIDLLVKDIHNTESNLSTEAAQWVALKDFMKQAWFRRRWVVQEVALARRATMHCGSNGILAWEKFAMAVSLLVHNERAAKELRDLAKGNKLTKNASDFFREIPALGAAMLVATTTRLRRIAGNEPQRILSLNELVSSLAIFNVSDPKDTIYALLALAKDSQASSVAMPDQINGKPLSEERRRFLKTFALQLNSSYRRRYIVNYDQTRREVFQYFIDFSIQHEDPTRALDVLCRPFAPGKRRLRNKDYKPGMEPQLNEEHHLPTWMPTDDRVPFQEVKTSSNQNGSFGGDGSYRIERQHGDAFVSMPGVPSYSAAGSSACDKIRLRFRDRKDHYSMFVEGFVLDTVAEVLEISRNNIPPFWISHLRAKADQDEDPDVLWRTLVANRSSNGEAPYFYKLVIESVLERHNDNQKFGIEREIEETDSSSVTQTLRQVQATIEGRRLIETERYIGLGPDCTAPGDLVCILYGCTSPVVLRRFEKTQTELDLEAADDEVERQERLSRLTERIRRWYARRSKAKNDKYRNVFLRILEKFVSVRLRSAPDSPDTTGRRPTRASIVARLGAMRTLELPLHVSVEPLTWKVLVLVLMVAFTRHVLMQDMMASLLTALLAPHILADLFDASSLAILRRVNQPLLSTIASSAVAGLVGILLSLLALDLHHLQPLIAPASMALLLILIFPTLLPPSLYQRFEASLQRRASSVTKKHRAQLKANQDYRDAERQKMKKYYYEVMGDCYINNMMNGEAITLQNLTNGRAASKKDESGQTVPATGPPVQPMPAVTFELR